MVQENTDIRVDITTDDVQAVMQSNPMVALQVQNRALMRKLGEAQRAIAELTESIKARSESSDCGEPGDIPPKEIGKVRLPTVEERKRE
jgi:hypothetical protein